MTKIYAALMSLIVGSGAAGAQKYYLEAIESQMNFDNFMYYYDDNDRLEAYFEEEDFGGADKGKLKFEFSYNESGEQTQMFGYQKLQTNKGEQYVNTMKYFFTYNDAKQVATQKNYNLDLNGGFKPGGVYEYSYSDNGTTHKRYLYYERDTTLELREITEYFYDDKGLLTEDITSSTWDTEENAEPESKTVYSYGDNGELLTRVGFYAMGTEWEYSQTEEFTYDEAGNLIDRLLYRADKANASERDAYTYKQETRENAVLPIYVGTDFDHNVNNMVMITSPNLIDTHTAYRVAADSGKLDIFDVSTYIYATERPSVAVNEIVADAEVPVYYDLMGRRVANPQCGIFIRQQGNVTTKIVK